MDNIVEEIMESYKEYIDKVPDGCVVICEYLRQDRITEALNFISDFSEGISWLVQATELLQENNIKFDYDFKSIIDYLKEINDGLLIGDYNLVADIFEYEVIPFFSSISAGILK